MLKTVFLNQLKPPIRCITFLKLSNAIDLLNCQVRTTQTANYALPFIPKMIGTPRASFLSPSFLAKF